MWDVFEAWQECVCVRVFVFVSGQCLLPLSIRARRQKLFSGALVHFSMKMRFAGPRVPTLLCRVCMRVSDCVRRISVCVCVCACTRACVWSLMSAGGCYCLQMWVLGNHKTQSLWSIPEPLPLNIAFSTSTHNLSPFHCFLHTHIHTHTHTHTQTHTHTFCLFFSLYFPSLLCLCHSSSLSSISYSHTHSISVLCYILLLSVVCLRSLDIFLVISLFSPVPSPAAPEPSTPHH